MAKKLSNEFPDKSNTTDDSNEMPADLKKALAKQAEHEEKVKQLQAKYQKKKALQKAREKKAEQKKRNRQMILLGIAYDYVAEHEKDGKLYDQNTEILNKGLLKRSDRKVFAGRIPALHRTDKGDKKEKPEA